MSSKRIVAGTAVIAAALTLGTVPAMQSQAATIPAAFTNDGTARETVRIPMDGGWVAEGELTYPRGASGRLPWSCCCTAAARTT